MHFSQSVQLPSMNKHELQLLIIINRSESYSAALLTFVLCVLTHRVVFAVLTENLGGDPALSARHPRPSTETVAAHC